MPRAVKASEVGLEPHWKVRIVVDGSIIHLAARNEPSVRYLDDGAPVVVSQWIEGPDYGDTLAFIDWKKVSAISWRYSP